jgi:Tn3 transposase DDE domain
LRETLDLTEALGRAGELPEVELSESGMKISPLESDHPDGVKALNEIANGMLSRLKITDLLLEVDRWTHFTRHLSHLKTGEPSKDPALLLTAILADAINLGLVKMAEACPDSLILRKLGSYPRQNSLALALRELGRIERTLFTLHWLQDPALHRRVQVGLNKGEARNALARAVFFYRLGEIRDRSFENQRYRASGLNLVVAAISLWNTVYLERAIFALRQQQPVDDALLKHLSPLGWEHINPTGDYVWHVQQASRRRTFPSPSIP